MIKYFFITAILFGWSSAVGQHLEKRVSIDVTDQPLEEVLLLLNEEYDLSLSFMNNELPQKKVTVNAKDKPLKAILDEVLSGSSLDYIELNGQVIIKRKSENKPPKQEDINTGKPADTTMIAEQTTDTLVQIPAEVEKEISQAEPHTVQSVVEPDTTLVQPLVKADTSFLEEAFLESETDEQSPKIVITAISGGDTTSTKEELKVRPFHFGLFYPISTNGYSAKNYINHTSFHLFAGYSGGIRGFEFSTVANAIAGDLNGMQLTGFVNVVQGNAVGGQISGALNVAKKHARGFQLAGITNVTKESNIGLQVAGVTNVAIGTVGGFQISNAVNVSRGQSYGQMTAGVNLSETVEGPQLAGLINFQHRSGNGVQLAGFMNEAKKLNGVQLASFLNKAENINGMQASGFINLAGNVKGVQIGLINISDSLSGVPIGLFSLVKRNGYLDLELFYAEDFHANAIIKLGSQKFHNLFGFSYETDYKNRWAYGYGFGSQWGKDAFRLNTDAITYYVIEKEFPDGAFNDYQLNLLTKFRMLISLHHHNFGLFAGPVFNVMVSKHQDAETDTIGSDIAPSPLYDYTSFDTNVKLWIGYNLGMRF